MRKNSLNFLECDNLPNCIDYWKPGEIVDQ